MDDFTSCGLGLLLVTAPVPAQAANFHPAPVMPLCGELVFDSQRNVLVVLEATTIRRMWEWNGAAFRQRFGPTHAFGSGPVFDPVRGEIHTAAQNGLASWNGAAWRTSTRPAGTTPPMAFDAARNRLVCWRGADVDEWDGVQWVRITPTVGPTGAGQLTFDPVRGRCVLAVGDPVALWTWDGNTWSLLSANGPSASTMSARALVYDPAGNRLVLALGGDPTTAAATWAFLGSAWQAIVTPATFSADAVSLGFDGIGLLRLGVASQLPEGLWRLESNAWRRLPLEHPQRGYPSVAASPQPAGVLLFGSGSPWSFDGTWTFAGAWQRHAPTTSPPARSSNGLAWCPADQQFVLFGGISGNLLSDTWTWDGTDWTPRLPATSPPSRSMPSLATDPTGGVLLVGGLGPLGYLGDHWRWLGGNWQNLGMAPWSPVSIPLASAIAAHDPVRNRTLVVCGQQAFEWDGASWSQLPPLPAATSSVGSVLVFRPDRQTMLLSDQWNSASGSYEWNGTQWVSANVFSYRGPSLAPDYVNQRVLGFHAESSPYIAAISVLTATPAAVARFGYGCAFGRTPGLLADGRPRPGNAAFAVDAATFAPNAPAALAIGFAQQPLHLGLGCVVWIAQPPAIHFLVADAGGHTRLPLPLPADNTLRGVVLLAQVAALDPQHSPIGGITLSDGLRIAIGD